MPTIMQQYPVPPIKGFHGLQEMVADAGELVVCVAPRSLEGPSHLLWWVGVSHQPTPWAPQPKVGRYEPPADLLGTFKWGFTHLSIWVIWQVAMATM